ncbi:MAG: hypothetical protein JXA18_09515 [Chitinispirillaceae bacterium]|nr:hypothetical protein [Chitinispirillaceae bacterium]
MYWIANYYYVKNLEEVYKSIDNAMTKGNKQLSVKIDWGVTPWKSKTTVCRKGTEIRLGKQLGSTPIYNGFAPWACNLTCIEADNDEYDAASKIFDNIGDYTFILSNGASFVSIAAGPSPVGIAAGAIASIASVVGLGADAVSAVIDIINLLDEDDVLGHVTVAGAGDYVDIKDDAVICGEYQTSSGNPNGPLYTITLEETLGPASTLSFERNWRIEQRVVTFGPYVRMPKGFWGGSGDDVVVRWIPEHWDSWNIVDVDYPGRGEKTPGGKTKRHAEWKPGEKLSLSEYKIFILPREKMDEAFLDLQAHGEHLINPNVSLLRGVVHWGTYFTYDITYTANAHVMRFIRPA